MKAFSIVLAACLTTGAMPALAQPDQGPPDQTQTTLVTPSQKPSGAAAGAATGAVAGAVVAGPVGAAVGAATGAVIGAAAAPPAEIRTYVTTQNVPAVAYSDPIVVGHPIDGDVTWLDIPSYPRYRWAYLNGRRVVVDTATHKVVAVY